MDIRSFQFPLVLLEILVCIPSTLSSVTEQPPGNGIPQLVPIDKQNSNLGLDNSTTKPSSQYITTQSKTTTLPLITLTKATEHSSTLLSSQDITTQSKATTLLSNSPTKGTTIVSSSTTEIYGLLGLRPNGSAQNDTGVGNPDDNSKAGGYVPMDLLQNTSLANITDDQTTPAMTTGTPDNSATFGMEKSTNSATESPTLLSATSSVMSSETVSAGSISTEATKTETTNVTSNYTTEQSTKAAATEMTTVVTSGLSTSRETTSNKTDEDDQDKKTDVCSVMGSTFGTHGLTAFIAVFGLCIFLMILLMVMIFKYTQRRNLNSRHNQDGENGVPKLKLLEIRNIDRKDNARTEAAASQDGLQTYSLDYEKHVQEKIDEHRRKTRAPSDTSTSVVSTFKTGKKPSLVASSSLSSATSPASPGSERPLLSDDDEPVVFNFIKKPGESLTEARRPSNGDRKKSSASTSKGRKGAEPSKDLFISDV